MHATRWIAPLRRAPRESVRLYCFHHAGGSALSFGGWPKKLPAGVSVFAVQLPGRDGSGSAAAARRLQDLIAPLMRAWTLSRQDLDPAVPFVFYGHSLGALVAFELVRALRDAREPQPSVLFVSGRRAPHRPLLRTPLCDLPDEALLRDLDRLGGMTAQLSANEKWRAFFIPLLRADLRLTDHYEYSAAPPLAVPIYAYRGIDDPILTHEELAAWRRESTASFSMDVLSGTHFFDADGLRQLHARLTAVLARLAPTPRAVPDLSAPATAAPQPD